MHYPLTSFLTCCVVLKKTLAEKGEDATESIEALEAYVGKCCETGTYLLDMGEYDEASRVIDDCLDVLKTDV